jgi:carbonic anhydrase
MQGRVTMKIKSLLTLSLLVLIIVSCQGKDPAETKTLIGDVVTAEAQKSLTPDDVLKDLMRGNERFVNNQLLERDFVQQIKNSEKGQFPKAVVISCLDSRVPVEYILDRELAMFLSENSR